MIPNSLSPLLTLAQAAPEATPAGPDGLKTLIMMGLMIVICYFILIRPQQRQQKELKKQLDALKVGDKVLTTGGILGIVSAIREKILVVKISENTKVEMLRSGIQQVVNDDLVKEDKKA